MKKLNTIQLLLICCISLLSIKTSAQLQEVVSGLAGPYGLAINPVTNHLYISQSADTNGNKISYIDLTSTNPIVNDVFTNNLSFPTKLKFHENYLYVTETDSNNGKISRANLTSGSTPIMQPYITTGVVAPISIEIKDNNIYVSDFDNANIIKFNTSTTPFQTSILTNDLATDIIIDGDNIYYASPFSGVIFSNSLTNPTPTFNEITTGILNPSSLLIHGSMMYVSDYFNGKVYRVNYQNSNVNTQLLTSGLSFPQHMSVYNNELYIAEMGANRIVKLNLANLSTEDFENAFSATIYPNPTQNILNIKTQGTIAEVSVHDMLGKKVTVNQLSLNTLDVSSLAKGLYIIKMTTENDQTYSTKFIKK